MIQHQFPFVHGFGEKANSDWAGLEMLKGLVKHIWANADITDNLFDSEGTIVKPHGKGMFAPVGNSWGGAAIFCFADQNPACIIHHATMIDAVASIFKKPPQWPWSEWNARPNIEHVTGFRQESGKMLRGTPYRGIPTDKKTVLADVGGMLKPAYIHQRYLKGPFYFEGQNPYLDEYIIAEDPKVLNELEHFTGLKNNKWAQDVFVADMKKYGAIWEASHRRA